MSFVLHSVELKNVAGVEQLALQQIPETGVTIIRGPNEAGKSTILKVIELFFDPKTKHTSQNAKVKSLVRRDKDVAPEVTVEFTLGPYRAQMTRVYSPKAIGKCELNVLAPKRQQFGGNEAEDWLADVTAQYLDTDLMKALTAQQGVALEVLKDVGDISPLTSGLGQSDGEVTDDASESPLLRRAKAEYLKYFTKGGQPSKDRKALHAKVAELTGPRDEAQQRVKQLERVVAKSGDLRERFAQLEADLPGIEAEINDKEAAFAQARDAEEKLTKLRERREFFAMQVTSKSDMVETRRTQRDRLTALTAEVAQATEAKEAAQKAAGEFDAAVTAKREELAAARAELKAQRTRSGQAQALVDWFAARTESQRAQERMATAEKAAQDVAAAKATLAQLTITNDEVNRLLAAENEASARREILERSAASVQISAAQPRTVGVNGVDTDLSQPQTLPVAEEVELTIDDVTVRICPDTNAQELQIAVDQAEVALAALRAELGVASVEEAAAQAREHDEAQQQHQAASAALTAELKGQQLTALVDEAEAAAATEAALAAQLEDADVAADNADEAREVLELAQQAIDEAEVTEAAATEAVDALLERSPASDLAQASKQLELKSEQLKELSDELERAVAEYSDEQLAQDLEAAQAQVTDFDEQIAQAQATGYDLELATAELTGARNRKRQTEKDRRAVELQLAELKSRVDDAEGSLQTLERLDSELDDAVYAAERADERAAAAQLLKETLETHQQQAREKYEKPLLDRLEHMAAPLFGSGVQFELNNNLEVVRRTVDDVTVDVAQLSGGAQEQLNILTRLAIAGLVADGEVAPVIIDDALGYTDQLRRTRMNIALNNAASGLQVLILTCEPERYAAVVPAAEYSMEELTLPADE
ncbi:AAA family ATPase [Corynebacterium ulceribovis]|uniref:AAA family ATPase n=1 Tax=Corynebacterium ulceribovis TaxID=487732 RepID=UPI00036CAE91|nr:AAA family ATPase [Corynebacterium ulceribovis]